MKSSNLAIVFVDIAGFTERTSQQSRVESEAWLKRFELLLMPLVRAFGGRRIKTIGDAYLLSFGSPTNALLFGMAAQDRLFSHNREVDPGRRFQIRVAVNAGEVRLKRRDVYGEPVNIAARVEGLTPPGEVWFTEAVYLAMTRSEVPAEEIGPRELKGIPEPVKLYRVPTDSTYRLHGGGSSHPTDGEQPGFDPELAPYPFGGLGLRRAEERGLVLGLGAVPERIAQAGQGILAGLWNWISGLPMPVWLGLAAAVLVIVLLVALVGGGPFGDCLDAVEKRDFTLAQHLLDSHGHRDSPQGKAVQARIWLRKPEPEVRRAAETLEGAIGQDRTLLSDDEVIRDLILTLNRRNASETIRVLSSEVGNRATGPLLEGTADRRYWVRWNSIKALEQIGADDDIDLGQVFILDLAHSSICSVRKKAAQKLGELGDKRALQPLRKAQQKNFFQNICMGNALEVAIRKIEGS